MVMMLVLVLIGLLSGALVGGLVVAASSARSAHELEARHERDLGQAAARVDAATAQVGALLDALPQALLVFDASGQMRLANGAGARYLHSRHGDALVEAAVIELVAGVLSAQVQSSRAASKRRLELVGPPRQTFELVAYRLVDGSDLVLVVVDDVSERRRLEEMRRDFVANISHELRTPLGALSLLAETMADEADPEVLSRLADRLCAEATRLTRTVDDLLLLSTIEGGEADAHPVSVSDLVNWTVDRVAGTAADRGIDVKVDVASPEVQLRGDRAQLVSALANLIDNALTYSDPGSIVLVRATVHADEVELAVIDRGIGIPARDLERVFERFYRVDRARSRRTGGTGLGLAIVRHVANNHGGTVGVESREGEGSTFTLRLPLEPAR
jgi:two-component system sensor histidine kinase SenX3